VCRCTRVCAVARELDLVVVSDEIYRDLVFDPGAPVLSPAEVAPERVVITSGLSKNLGLGGWRIGVARLPEGATGTGLRDQMLTAASEIWSGVAQPVQHAAALAFTEPDDLTGHIAAARAMYARLSGAVADRFARAGALVPAPRAAFYVYPDFEPLRERLATVHSVHTGAGLGELLLRRHGVAVLPGSEFGEPDRSLCLRVCTGLLSGDDDDQRERALRAAAALDRRRARPARGRARPGGRMTGATVAEQRLDATPWLVVRGERLAAFRALGAHARADIAAAVQAMPELVSLRRRLGSAPVARLHAAHSRG
jgi:aspartate/methionine/tyrosine aminotransferase